jgi:hypothetical protein
MTYSEGILHHFIVGFLFCNLVYHVWFCADIPAEKPVLTVDKYRYATGEQIQANCTSWSSFPGANITWFVNGQQVRIWNLH